MAARKSSSKSKKGKGKARPKRPIPVRAAPDGSELCLQCGLCCDGTLFSYINLEEGEREFVESLGLEVVFDGDLVCSPEPCPAFTGGCCSLYQRGRPETCGSDRCGLLDEYLAETRVLDEALAVVRLVWSLARQLEREMGLPFSTYHRRALQQFLDEHEPWATPTRYAHFLRAFHRLNILGEKYFNYAAKPAEVEASEAGAQVAADDAASALGAAPA
jgi:hypothetical protein